MRGVLLLGVIVLAVVGFSCCSGQSDRSDNQYLILISIDGFRYDYAEKFQAKNILKFAAEGVRAEHMVPSFPTKTFPNHYTIVTGLYPDHHGIVGNVFYDSDQKEWYKVGDASIYDSSWYGGVPLWVLAAQQGKRSASYFWPGSEVNILGYQPDYFEAYDNNVPNQDRFNKVLSWLNLPEDERPQFISMYFSLVDNVGHRFGPDAEQTEQAVLEIDSLLGQFMDQLNNIDLPVNMVLVSDHGMSNIKYGVVLPDLVDLTGLEVSTSLPVMIYGEDSARLENVYQILKSDERFQTYKKAQLPDHLHFGENEMVGDLVLISEPPTVFLREPQRVYGGTHGFDPAADSNMSAFFAANGPAFKKHEIIPAFENIHIYPMMAEVLGLLMTDSIDGKQEVLAPILK